MPRKKIITYSRMRYAVLVAAAFLIAACNDSFDIPPQTGTICATYAGYPVGTLPIQYDSAITVNPGWTIPPFTAFSPPPAGGMALSGTRPIGGNEFGEWPLSFAGTYSAVAWWWLYSTWTAKGTLTVAPPTITALPPPGSGFSTDIVTSTVPHQKATWQVTVAPACTYKITLAPVSDPNLILSTTTLTTNASGVATFTVDSSTTIERTYDIDVTISSVAPNKPPAQTERASGAVK